MPISDKPDDLRTVRGRSEPATPPVLRRGREHRIVRWIGAGNQKLPKSNADAASETARGHVIKLCWSDTFGRPVRPDLTGFARSAPGQVLPFRGERRGAG
ncbi:hypothetical protein FOHLNKBM_3210 [Methylobacterium longum]|nr:hypothetical protein FOHLNKBM_3210 [Methylobacterium longum]